MGVLRDAQTQGFVGGRVPLHEHVRNGLGFATVIDAERCRTIVDLGSGGGLPALVIAVRLVQVEMTLIERGTRRAGFLQEAVAALDLADRVRIVIADAEEAARRPGLEASADVATARSFGPPAVTAEAACRYLRQGGRLVVSEPPPATEGAAHGSTRWPPAGLGPTGLVPDAPVRLAGTTFQVLRRSGSIDPRVPRRAATSRKRPLFDG